MKLASYIADNHPAFGVVIGDGVVTMNVRTRYANLREAIAAGALDELRRLADGARPDHKLGEIRFLPAIPDPEKFSAPGSTIARTRPRPAVTSRKPPSMFVRFTDTLVGHDGEMIRPTVSECFDFEGELAIVIGRAGRHIRPERALDARRRLHLLRRRQRARLPEDLRHLGQELSRHRPARAVDRHHRRDS